MSLGLATELLIVFRKVALAGSDNAIFGTAMHVVQLVLGYFLMLMAMTYHVPVFVAVIAGVGIGHWIGLRWRRMTVGTVSFTRGALQGRDRLNRAAE